MEQMEKIVNTKITQEKELRTKIIKLKKELMDLHKEYSEIQVKASKTVTDE